MEIKSMTMDELRNRLAEIREAVLADDADLDALETETRTINEEIELRQAVEAKKQEIRNMIANDVTPASEAKVIEKQEDRSMPTNAEIRNSEAYINAYADYIKTGDDSECRSLLTENVQGAIPVPEFVYDEVKHAWENEGIVALVRKTNYKGNLKVGFEVAAGEATAHTEGGAAVSEEELTRGIVELVPVSIKKWISFSDEVLDMGGQAFLTYIYDELAHKIAKKAADVLIADIEARPATSSATNGPGVAKITASSIAMGTVASAIGQLSDEAANPVIMMNKATWAAFKAVQYANGYGADPFEGLTVLFNSTIKSFDAASTGDTFLIVGDLGEGALMNLPNGEGVDFKVDDKTLMTSDMVRILGRTYIAAKVVAPYAFCKVAKAS